jgi:hypothetical protein
MTFRCAAGLFIVAILAAMLAACGSNSSSPQQVTLSYSASQYTPPSSMTAGTSQGFAATATNGSANATLTWSLTCSQSDCGTLNPGITQNMGVTGYTAPVSVPSGGLTVTVTTTYSGVGTATPLSSKITINPQQVTLAYTSLQYTPPSSMTAGATAGFAVTITNGSANATVNWTVTCGQASCGTFSSASTQSTVVTTYTAPTSVPSGGLSVTVTATYAGTGTAAPLTSIITINPAVVSVTFSSVPSTLLIQGTANVAVTVTGDPENAGVRWSCTPSSQCGSFNTTSSTSAIYTAPSIVPSGQQVTVTATSVTDPTASAHANITITSNVTVTFPSAGNQYAPTNPQSANTVAQIAATTGASDPNNAGVTWSVTCTGALCGSFSATSTGNGTPTNYTAPAAVAGNDFILSFTPANLPPASMNTNTFVEIAAAMATTVTIVATSVTDYTKTATFTITIDDPAGVNWSCTPVSQCGTFDPTTPTGYNVAVTYTSPASVPATNPVTITATSVSIPTMTKSANITITQPPTTLPCPGPAGSECNYVFQLSGEDNHGQSPFNVAGVFTIQSGAITGGEQDFVDLSFVGNDPIAADSTIVNTTDGNLQIVLDTSDSNIGPIVDGTGNGLETLNVTLVTSTTGLVTWFDGFAAGNGTIALQEATAAQTLPQNGYAFVVSGSDNNASPAPVVMGGIINVDGTSGTISGTGSVLDFSDGSAAAPEPDQPLAATSTVAGPSGPTPDQYGKVAFTLDSNATPAIPKLVFAGYIIDANTIALVEVSDDFGGATGGIALAQGSKTGQFGTTDLSGSTYVVGAQGADDFFFLNFAGALSFGSGGSLTGTADFNDQTTESSGSVTGTYAVDSTGISAGTGRVTITNFTGSDLNSDPTSDLPHPATLQLYLDGNGNALMASMDLYDFTAGPAFKQTGGASLSGSYALSGVGVSATTFNTWSAVGPINIGSNGTIGSGSFTDFNYFSETLPATECGTAAPTCADLALSGTASNPNGPITGLDADSILTPPIVPDTFDFYVIDSLRAFGIETDLDTQTGLLYLQGPTAPQAHARTHK